ncbi:MAG: methyltransferase domain-containing protein, partial [Thiohalobacteraceae bacterium]
MSDDSNQARIDKHQVRSSFGLAAADYDRVAVLQREVGTRLLERLELIKAAPRDVLDLGSGTGYIARALTARYRRARVVAVDIAAPMLTEARRRSGWWRRRPQLVCGDMECLPFADGSVDM